VTEPPIYQVLARKYRPQTFADLIGQEAMVRTLRNAFAAGRIAHAFVMTGVRGVGKTTTARIIAKGLNCVGPDGTGGSTIEPCGVCGPCRAIAEGRHIDVLEYDAASNTQVDKMRDILASIPYRPVESRYKVIIFDEVHMLSDGSFNALLKTLEEPPPHVKFIFATTEIRKVPATILSRCQRFDLRRIEPEVLAAHLAGIATRESVTLAPDALALIVRAAEGSVRDALSLMDQAIAHGAGAPTADMVRDMLGLADRGRTLDLFGLVMGGDAAGALAELGRQYANGADPMAVLRDLADVTHAVSVAKITPGDDDPTIAADERARTTDFAARLPMRVLSRAWQMLLKAIEEVALAPNAMMAAEMALIRLTHVADLPDPEALIRRLQSQAPPPAPRSPTTATPPVATRPTAEAIGNVVTAPALAPDDLRMFATFDQVVALIRDKRDQKLLIDVEDGLRLVSYSPGRITFEPAPTAAPDLAQRLGARLQGWTGARWAVIVAQGGAPTIAETRTATAAATEAEVTQTNPIVQAILATFPGAKIARVRDIAPPSLPTAESDDWDPFEDD
jgi:DNA polymerase III subunit gamma/tau